MTAGALPRELVRRAAQVDRGALQPLLALRPALGLILPIAIGFATAHPIGGIAIGTGALVAGTASISGTFEPPVLMVALSSVIAGVSTFVGSATGNALAIHLPLVVLWAFASGMSVALGKVPSTVGTQATVALLVFGRFPLGVPGALQQGALVAAGGLIQAILAGVLRTPGRFRGERRAVAATYLALAAYARDLSRGGSALAAGEAAHEAQAVLSRSWAAPGSEARDAFDGLLAGARRIRIELSALHDARVGLADATELDRWLVQAAQSLASIARGVRGDTVTDVELPELTLSGGGTRWLVGAETAALAGQLRAAARLVDEQRSAHRGPLHLPQDLADSVRTLRVNLGLGSTTFRHALRLAVIMPIAVVVSRAVDDQRGYWVPLTVLLLLKPDFVATAVRGVARFGGTLLGVVLASLVADGLHPHGAVTVVLIAILGWAAYACFQASYGLYALCISALVVFLISAVAPSSAGIAADRLRDTAIGAGLAIAVYLAWPSWEGPQLDVRVSALLRAQRRYLLAVLDTLAGDRAAGEDRHRLGDEARAARSNAETSLARAGGEPRRFAGDLGAVREILGPCRLLARAAHTLSEAGQAGVGAGPVAGIVGFRAAIDRAYDTLGTAAFPALRAAHDTLCEAAGQGDLAELVVIETDRVVDALDTVHEVFRRVGHPPVAVPA